MTDLERFAAVVLSQWQAEGGHVDGPIGIGSLLDRTFPYRSARRMLGIEASEDYESLVLRLLGEEAKLVETSPPEAAEMARTTMASKLPDLDVLTLLRSATITFSEDAVLRLDGVRPITPAVVEAADATRAPVAPRGEQVLAMRRSAPPAEPASAAEPDRSLVEHLTGVAFIPPSSLCWSCDAPLPSSREAKFCVECGADQRTPLCSGCGTAVERAWKHCSECGLRLPAKGSSA